MKDISAPQNKFTVTAMDLETSEYTVILNRQDAVVMGLNPQDRVKVVKGGKSLTAILEITDSVVDMGNVGILKNGQRYLGVGKGDVLKITPATRPKSVDIIKKRMNGLELTKEEIAILMEEISNHRLSDIELSAYVTSTYMKPLNNREIRDFIINMVKHGEVLDIDLEPIFDFHSIGGVPGNKVTLLVIPIVAAAGLSIPKTCSRAISSAGGTADILETIANVTLPGWRIKEITETVGGTIAWGGGVNIAPADDIIIRAEYPLAIDPYSQVIASVLAKKKAVGADYLLIDIPTGANTKVEDIEKARKYARDFRDIGEQIGIKVECAITYGGQPVGRNIGPALEVKEALASLEGDPPSSSTVEKATSLAGIILEMGGYSNSGKEMAESILEDGSALKKFKEIVEAQGSFIEEISSSVIREGRFSKDVISSGEGYVASINNRQLVRIARAAGCPHEKYAGLVLEKKKGHQVDRGDVLFTIHSDNRKRLEYALRTAKKLRPYHIEGMVLERIASDGILHDPNGNI